MSGGSVLDRLQNLDARMLQRNRGDEQAPVRFWGLLGIRASLGALWIALGAANDGSTHRYSLIVVGVGLLVVSAGQARTRVHRVRAARRRLELPY